MQNRGPKHRSFDSSKSLETYKTLTHHYTQYRKRNRKLRETLEYFQSCLRCIHPDILICLITFPTKKEGRLTAAATEGGLTGRLVAGEEDEWDGGGIVLFFGC